MVPDLVTIVMAAPPVRPSAAVNWLVESWNCSSASVENVINGPPYRLSRLSAPSTVDVLLLPEAPPNDTLPTLSLLRWSASIGAAPGSRASSPLTLRVIIGRFCSSVASIVEATFDCVTSMSGAAPVTVTASATPASASRKSSVIVALMASVTPSRAVGANPGSSVLTS